MVQVTAQNAPLEKPVQAPVVQAAVSQAAVQKPLGKPLAAELQVSAAPHSEVAAQESPSTPSVSLEALQTKFAQRSPAAQSCGVLQELLLEQAEASRRNAPTVMVLSTNPPDQVECSLMPRPAFFM